MVDTFTMSQKAMAKHLRDRLKFEGIKSRVRMLPPHIGSIQVLNAEHGVLFTEREQRMIQHIAKCNGLTHVAGMPIEVGLRTSCRAFEFYPPAPWA